MATVGVELELVGSAEGVPVEIAGSGSVDTDSGRLALEVHASRRLSARVSRLLPHLRVLAGSVA